jgi:hypothetical protein
MLFTRLITYDALYFKGTDAASLYDAYGDVIGGIGSYPVLGSPHYHQPSDRLEFENHQLILETSKTTVASVMLLASSPSRPAPLVGSRLAVGRGINPVEASSDEPTAPARNPSDHHDRGLGRGSVGTPAGLVAVVHATASMAASAAPSSGCAARISITVQGRPSANAAAPER